MKEKSAEFAEFSGRRMNGSFFDLRIVWGLTSLYIFVDSVSIPGPFVKWVITKSSSDIVNASRNPEKIPGMISGRTTFLNA